MAPSSLFMVLFFGTFVAATLTSVIERSSPNTLTLAQFAERMNPVTQRLPLSALGIRVTKFSWSSCGKPTDIVQIKTLALTPDLKITGTAEVSAELAAPLQVDLEIQKRVIFYVTIPCIRNVGSCSYPNICGNSPSNAESCPVNLPDTGFPCSCPFPAGAYAMNNFMLELDLLNGLPDLPSWLVSGYFKVKVEIKKDGKTVSCTDASFTVDS